MFYTFSQNNSGGSFIEDDRVTQYVIIEANSADAANALAEVYGLYFNGCDDGRDCPCCGDRWYRTWEGEGTEHPEIYGKPAADEFQSSIIYYQSGTVTRINPDHKKRKRR